MRIRVHVQGFKGSGPVEEGEEAAALFNGVLEVDGTLIEEVNEIAAVFSGGEFAKVRVDFIAGTFEIVTHTKESWPELLRQIDEKRAVSGANRVIVVNE